MAASLHTSALVRTGLPFGNQSLDSHHPARAYTTALAARETVTGARLGAPRKSPRGVQARRGLAVKAARGFLANMAELDEPETAVKLEYDLPLEIVKYPDPRLRAENKLVGPSCFNESLSTLTRAMLDIMYETDGVGLAAPQIGANLRIMVINPEGHPQKGPEYIFVNPRIVKAAKKIETYEEGCLSFPLMLGNVERPASCKIAYQDITGKRKKMDLSGWEARIFLHEMDHLEGKLFHDRMSEDVLQQVKPELEAFEKAFEGAQ